MRHLLVLLIAALIAPAAVAAQTPGPATPSAFPIAPAPIECTVAPRTQDELATLVPEPVRYTDAATPAPSPDPGREILLGPTEPATPEQIGGITETTVELAACLTANDGYRLAGLYSDSLLATGIVTADPSGTVGPSLPSGQRITLVDIISPRTFTDGRVGAVVLFNDPRSGSPVDSDFIVFARDRDRWLIDDFPVYARASSNLPDPADAEANRAAWGLIEPDPADCQVTPRDADALATLVATSAAGPVRTDRGRTPEPVWPTPRPADPETVAAIEATVAELSACIATGDLLRISAFYGDDLLASPYFSLNVDAEGNAVDSGPAAIAVFAVLDYGDGRIGAVIGFQSSPFATPVYPLFMVFEHIGGRWLISELPLPGYSTESSSGEPDGSFALTATITP